MIRSVGYSDGDVVVVSGVEMDVVVVVDFCKGNRAPPALDRSLCLFIASATGYICPYLESGTTSTDLPLILIIVDERSKGDKDCVG